MAKGLTNGLMVCRYAFKRMNHQEPLPQRDLDQDDDNNKADAAKTELSEL